MIGKASDAFWKQVRDDRRFGELGMAGVEHNRRARHQRMLQGFRQPAVPAFGHSRGQQRRVALGRVVIDVEVLCWQHAERERMDLNFIVAEILGGRGVDRREQTRQGSERQGQRSHHGTSSRGTADRGKEKRKRRAGDTISPTRVPGTAVFIFAAQCSSAG